MKTLSSVIFGVACILAVHMVFAAENGCDKTCLERLAEDYRVAYLQHDPSKAPIAKNVKFTENSVEMPFPDASWDTVTKDLGPVLIISDPVSGQVAISTAIMQMNDIPGFITMRLKVKDGEITEIEHIISTKRNLSGPPRCEDVYPCAGDGGHDSQSGGDLTRAHDRNRRWIFSDASEKQWPIAYPVCPRRDTAGKRLVGR